MATHLDLEEQEQLDRLKHFWARWGSAITLAVLLVLGGFTAWKGYEWYQRDQAAKAGALFDELERAAGANETGKVAQAFGDLRSRFASTAFTQQGALLAATVQFNAGQVDEAVQTLTWAAANAREDEYRTVARLRLAGVLLEQKKPAEALAQLDQARAAGFEALVADRRGDAHAALGKPEAARAAWAQAYAAMDPKIEYRRLIEAKLAAVGAPAPADAASAAQGSAR